MVLDVEGIQRVILVEKEPNHAFVKLGQSHSYALCEKFKES